MFSKAMRGGQIRQCASLPKAASVWDCSIRFRVEPKLCTTQTDPKKDPIPEDRPRLAFRTSVQDLWFGVAEVRA